MNRLIHFFMALLLAGCTPATALPTPTLPPPTVTRLPPTATIIPSPAPTPRPTPAFTPTPTPIAGPLELWAAVPETAAAAFQTLVDDLTQSGSLPVRVTIKDSEALITDIRARLITDQPLPDLVWGTQTDLRLLQSLGVLQPAADGLEISAVLPAVAAMADVDGRRWGTPLGAQHFLLLLYNRKIIEAAPRTTDELILQARRLNGRGQVGIVAGWAEPRWFLAWLTGMGGGVAGPDGQPTLDTPETIATLNLLRELRTAGPPPPSSYAQGVALFEKGNTAFAIDGDWSLAGYRQLTETLDLAFAPLPRVNATGNPAAPPLDGVYLLYGASLRGERLAAAQQLGRRLADPQVQARIARDLGILPALRATLRDPAVTGDPALAAAAATALQAPPLPGGPTADCIWSAIERIVPAVLLGDLNAEEGAARMQELAVGCVRARR